MSKRKEERHTERRREHLQTPESRSHYVVRKGSCGRDNCKPEEGLTLCRWNHPWAAAVNNDREWRHNGGHDGATCAKPHPRATTSTTSSRPGHRASRSGEVAAEQPRHQNPKIGLGLRERPRGGFRWIHMDIKKQRLRARWTPPMAMARAAEIGQGEAATVEATQNHQTTPWLVSQP
jgi:hypothetical protein